MRAVLFFFTITDAFYKNRNLKLNFLCFTEKIRRASNNASNILIQRQPNHP
jgi:hypothetical protein